MRKQLKEINSQHYKILKMKDKTIENLKKFKSAKDAEERDLKVKQKKINKKLKRLQERDSKLVKKVQNNNIPNNNKIPEPLTNPCPCSNISHTKAVVTSTITDITLCPSPVTHCESGFSW